MIKLGLSIWLSSIQFNQLNFGKKRPCIFLGSLNITMLANTLLIMTQSNIEFYMDLMKPLTPIVTISYHPNCLSQNIFLKRVDDPSGFMLDIDGI